MKNNLLFLFLVISLSCTGVGQNINSYKYILVPDSFGFLEERNQYQLNSLTKFLFEEQGFEAYMLSEKPPKDFSRSEALYVDVKDNGGLLYTKLVVELLDENNKLVFISEEGVSKEKEYWKAYHEALRKAFKSIAALKYTFTKDKLIVADEVELQSGPVINDFRNKAGSKEESEKLDIEKKEYKFEYETKLYHLYAIEKGFLLKESQSGLLVGKLYKTVKPDLFIFTSKSGDGIAQLNNKNDLIVEIINKNDEVIVKRVYNTSS
jgi:hypothetical protein